MSGFIARMNANAPLPEPSFSNGWGHIVGGQIVADPSRPVARQIIAEHNMTIKRDGTRRVWGYDPETGSYDTDDGGMLGE